MKKVREYHSIRAGTNDPREMSHGRSGAVGQFENLTDDEKQCLFSFVRKNIRFMFHYKPI